MIRCVVPEDNGIILPPRRLLVEFLKEVSQEDPDAVAVCRRVAEAKIDLAFCIQSRDQGKSRRHCVHLLIAETISRSPDLTDVARLVYPRLVDVDDAMMLF